MCYYSRDFFFVKCDCHCANTNQNSDNGNQNFRMWWFQCFFTLRAESPKGSVSFKLNYLKSFYCALFSSLTSIYAERTMESKTSLDLQKLNIRIESERQILKPTKALSVTASDSVLDEIRCGFWRFFALFFDS